MKARADAIQLASIVEAQENALEELKKVSPTLYKAAVEVNIRSEFHANVETELHLF